MEIQIAANLLAVSMLLGTAVAFLSIVVVFVNNIIFKYWKYLGWFKHWNFVDQKTYTKSEIKEPTLGESKSKN